MAEKDDIPVYEAVFPGTPHEEMNYDHICPECGAKLCWYRIIKDYGCMQEGCDYVGYGIRKKKEDKSG